MPDTQPLPLSANCPKCGAVADLRFEYGNLDLGTRDTLRARCTRCDYKWNVRPLDDRGGKRA